MQYDSFSKIVCGMGTGVPSGWTIQHHVNHTMSFARGCGTGCAGRQRLRGAGRRGAHAAIIPDLWDAGALCLTQASRLDERSTVAIVGEMLRTQLLARGGGCEDGALADAVPDYVRSISLPGLFAAGAAGVEDLRAEAKDMMAYHRSVLGRREVERAKIHHGRDGYLQG